MLEGVPESNTVVIIGGKRTFLNVGGKHFNTSFGGDASSFFIYL